MPAPRCSTCGQRRAQCACPPPDLQDTLALAVREQDARVLARTQGVEDAYRLLRACATLPTELPLLLQAAVDDALTTIRHLLLPHPQIPKGPRGRRPDFEAYEAFQAALDAGLRRFPRRETLTKPRFASYGLSRYIGEILYARFVSPL